MKIWLKGLIAAVIGGAANSVCAMVVDPKAFNFDDFGKLGKLALASAIVSLAFYLKQSPVPPSQGDDSGGSTRRQYLWLVCVLLLLLPAFSGCALFSKDPVVNAERVLKTSKATVVAFLKLEHEFGGKLKEKSPQTYAKIHAFAEDLRRDVTISYRGEPLKISRAFAVLIELEEAKENFRDGLATEDKLKGAISIVQNILANIEDYKQIIQGNQ